MQWFHLSFWGRITPWCSLFQKSTICSWKFQNCKMKTSYSRDQSFSMSVRILYVCVLMGATVLTVLKVMENFQEATYEYQLSSFNKAVDHLFGSFKKYNISNNIVILMRNFQNSWDWCMLEHFRKIGFKYSRPIYLILSL